MQHVSHRRSDEIHQLMAEIERLNAALANIGELLLDDDLSPAVRISNAMTALALAQQ